MFRSLCCLCIGLSCASCGGKELVDAPGPGAQEPPAAPSVTDVRPPLPAPEARDQPQVEDPGSGQAILQRSSAVIEAVVQAVSFGYDEQNGPRTNWILTVESVYAGESPGKQVQLSMFGGPAPDGDFVGSSLTTNLLIGSRYVLFLRNDEWFDSPLSTTALRVEAAFGREVLVSPDGEPLNGLSPEGMRFGRELFSSVSGPGVDPTVERLQSSVRKEADQLSVAGSLDRRNFKRLFAEAVIAEGVGPNRHFAAKPTIRHENWRVTPSSPSAE